MPHRYTAPRQWPWGGGSQRVYQVQCTLMPEDLIPNENGHARTSESRRLAPYVVVVLLPLALVVPCLVWGPFGIVDYVIGQLNIESAISSIKVAIVVATLGLLALISVVALSAVFDRVWWSFRWTAEVASVFVCHGASVRPAGGASSLRERKLQSSCWLIPLTHGHPGCPSRPAPTSIGRRPGRDRLGHNWERLPSLTPYSLKRRGRVRPLQVPMSLDEQLRQWPLCAVFLVGRASPLA
jgi:hypothetical protein